MHVLMINGSPHANGCTFTALSEVAGQLEKAGITTEIFHLGTDPVQDCTACLKCVKTGHCAFGANGVNHCIDLLEAADGLVVGSPVYYGGPTGALCSFLDRLFFRKVHKYAFKPAAAVGSCRRTGSVTAFDRLNKYFTAAQMPVVSSRSWNCVFGNTPEKVRQDFEGMQTMHTLGNNMAWLIRCIDAAKSSVPYPQQEERVFTNFIR
ncbi:MAG: flavodoxin family protein [Desulfobulbus sp.]|nr:flavodoxin family protein [Desulfobulbus sp.]